MFLRGKTDSGAYVKLSGLNADGSRSNLSALRAPVTDNGPRPSDNHVFLRGKTDAGTYLTLSGLNADGSRSNLQGKAA